jgi:general secretion pathway protein A
MYKAYFKLTHNPFDLTPDPVCFVPTERHNEALAALYHGVRRHKGFVVVTGEVGTGKTLLLRCLLGLLKESKDVAYAYMFNGRLSPTEFLQYILSDFGLPAAGKIKYELLLDLGRFLVARGAKRMTTVLIVDEAHLLSPEILEEVRLLSNLETTDDKLLQIVLVGQPELDEMLDSVELRQIKQRIAVRTQLIPLDAEETRVYIEKRLQIAGADPDSAPLFSGAAVGEVFLHSKGLPRLINTICENALIAAYAKRQPYVTPEIIGSVAKELRLDMVSSPIPIKTGGHNEMDIHRTMAAIVDLYDAMRKSNGSKASSEAPVEMEVSKHEPYI